MTANADRLRRSLKAWVPRVAQAWGPELADAMRKEAPISTPTPTSTRPPGQLRKSIKADRARATARGAKFTLRAPVIQAVTTDKGSPGGQIIRPKHGKALRFYWPKGPAGPRVYLFRSVVRGGNAPQDWWQPGLRRRARESLAAAARRTPF